VFLTRLRQATAHPFLLEIVLKKDLLLEDLHLIQKYLKKHGGRTSVIQQIQEWRAGNLDASFHHSDTGTFGESQFGYKLRMNEHISSAIALKGGKSCSLCLRFMEDPKKAEVCFPVCQCIRRVTNYLSAAINSARNVWTKRFTMTRQKPAKLVVLFAMNHHLTFAHPTRLHPLVSLQAAKVTLPRPEANDEAETHSSRPKM
jgi:hypothetical protein